MIFRRADFPWSAVTVTDHEIRLVTSRLRELGPVKLRM